MQSRNGKTVLCTSGIDGEEVNHWVGRELCLLESRPACGSCPNSKIDMVFQIGLGQQTVACPRWESDKQQREGQSPSYVFIDRKVCLTEKPFSFCPSCPNSNPSELPRDGLKWLDEDIRKRKIEAELDTED
jgi:hypothetical protein